MLSVRGRLLKDRALRSVGNERRRLYREASRSYARAAEIGGATYPLINAAALSLLAGQGEQARELARQVLERLDGGAGEPDTPYYQEATRAEALLLLGADAEARASLAAAIARAPRAWEDHASTLRQFALILDETGRDKAWLDPMRPPRCLHFAGHMDLAAGAGELADQVRAVLREERVGFGFGALAAGADIVIAEALLDEGAELELVLPGGVPAFRLASAASAGADWARRFDRVLARAAVRAVGPAGAPPNALSIRLGAEAAMGAAAMHAEILTTEAIQLLILDAGEAGDAGVSGSIGQAWIGSGRRQRLLRSPRGRSARRGAPAAPPDPACLAALIEIQADAETLPRLAEAIAAGPAPMAAPRWSHGALSVAFARPAEAARAALHIAASLNGRARIAGHYGIVHRVEDPFGGPPLLLGPAAMTPASILASVPEGAVHVTQDFAAALHAAGAPGARTELVGELPGGDADSALKLYSLQPRGGG